MNLDPMNIGDFSKGLKISVKVIFKFYWYSPTNNGASFMRSAGKK